MAAKAPFQLARSVVGKHRRSFSSPSTCVLLVLFSLIASSTCQADVHRPHRHHRLRGAKRSTSSSKHLYCKPQGGCSQCQENEEIERYCADTGFKELLRCTTDEQLQPEWEVILTYPYPSDVHIDDERNVEAEGNRDGWRSAIRVVRGCTEKTVRAHKDALAAEVAAAEEQHGGMANMPLFNFELAMCLLLGLALPVVYWRKIRIRHL